MSDELPSSPATPTELNAGLALVAAAQGENPWDANCFWPRVLGAGPQVVMAVWNEDDQELTLYFDEELDDFTSPQPENFILLAPVEDPGDCDRRTTESALITDNSVLITSTHGINESFPPQIEYTGQEGDPLIGESGDPVGPFVLPLVSVAAPE